MQIYFLRDIVGKVGPVSNIFCVEDSFHHYGDGIYSEPGCCTKATHATLIVGYGTDPKHGDYWIVKNSWGL